MQGRIRVWKHAGEIAKQIPAGIKRLHPNFPPNTTLVLLNVPHGYRDAYVFLTGVERAVALEYPGTPLLILSKPSPVGTKPSFIIDCSDGDVRDVAEARP